MRYDGPLQHDGHGPILGVGERRGLLCRAPSRCDEVFPVIPGSSPEAMVMATTRRDEHEQVVHEYVHQRDPLPGIYPGFSKTHGTLRRRAHAERRTA